MIRSRKIGGIRFTRVGRLQVSTCICRPAEGSQPVAPRILGAMLAGALFAAGYGLAAQYDAYQQAVAPEAYEVEPTPEEFTCVDDWPLTMAVPCETDAECEAWERAGCPDERDA